MRLICCICTAMHTPPQHTCVRSPTAPHVHDITAPHGAGLGGTAREAFIYFSPSGCGDLNFHLAVSHQCQPARWCERFTMCGLGWERICRVLSLCHFVALYARMLILHTEHVRHRGGEQQQQQIVAFAGACEFVARLRGECERTSTVNHIVVVRKI